MAHLGDNLKSWRKVKEWNQPEMAEYLDIGHRTYQDIESTGIVKKIEDLNKIQLKTGLNTQINAQPESAIERAIVVLSNSYAMLAETHKEVVSTNKELTLMLKSRLNSNSSKQVSRPSQKKGVVRRGPSARMQGSLDKPETGSREKKKVGKRDISVD